jgi:uncharacterized protein YbjT (DUF2867 family)
MAAPSTIIFGPTGGVGSAAARATQERGAKVFLAMRDPKKPVPGLDVEQERQGGFERVQADLTNPDSIKAAVTKTGAKRAFIYLVHGSADHMKSTIVNLKSAGIEFVVFLSSFGVKDDPRSILPSEFISYAHAQVEINLEEVFGATSYVAVRPAWFASNIVPYEKSIRSGEVRIPFADVQFDWISPMDIGSVCGTLLAKGPSSAGGKSFLILCGPELLSQKDAATMIGKTVGKEVNVIDVGEEEGQQIFTQEHGMPEPVAKYLLNVMKGTDVRTRGPFQGPVYEEAASNIQKVLERPPMRFQEWVNHNKQRFA